MVSPHTQVFPARMDAFPLVAAFLEEVCAVVGLGRTDCLRLTLLAEELFTNTVRHGHGGDSDAPVRVTVDRHPEGFAMVYEDTAPPHDPFAGLTLPDPAASVEDRPVGGLGVLLVAGMASRADYVRADDRNRIVLVLHPSPAAT